MRRPQQNPGGRPEAPLTPSISSSSRTISRPRPRVARHDPDLYLPRPGCRASPTATARQRVTPETTHYLVQHIHDNRRIFTDGRDWPENFEPTSSAIRSAMDRYRWRRPLRPARGRNPHRAARLRSQRHPLHTDNGTASRSGFPHKSDPNRCGTKTVFDSADASLTVIKSYRRSPMAAAWARSIAPRTTITSRSARRAC